MGFRPVDGIDIEDCSHLREIEAETSEYLEELLDTNRDLSALDFEEKEEILKVDAINRRVGIAISSACGFRLRSGPTGDGDFDCDDLDEWHEDLDEYSENIRETFPELIVRDDLGYDNIAAEENNKRIAVNAMEDAKESIRDLSENWSCDDPPEGERIIPASPMQVECKYQDPEKRQECIERRIKGRDVKTTGVTRSGKTFPV